jgi:hypothetical protein
MVGAIFSQCGSYRYRLERHLQLDGPVFAYFGINGSTATALDDDQTLRKWIRFTHLNNGRSLIVGNVFGYRATDVSVLAIVKDPVGPDNDVHLAAIVADADILVPCWGSRRKVPKQLHYRFEEVKGLLFASGKPVKVWGFTQSGDPLHPLTLAYATKLVDWRG